jgi:hypothetical protein
MRSILWTLAVSILLMLVVTGLNISNQGINDLTLNNPGYVIAVHVEDSQVYVEALGARHRLGQELISNSRAFLAQLQADVSSRTEVFVRQGQVEVEKTRRWMETNAWEKLRQWLVRW